MRTFKRDLHPMGVLKFLNIRGVDMDHEKIRQLEEMLRRENDELARSLSEFRHLALDRAEEAVQSAVFKAVRMLAERPQEGRIIDWKPYIMAAAINELKMEARDRKNGLPILRGKAGQIALANCCDPALTPVSKVEEKELAALAWAEMLKLPEQQREVLTRRYRDTAPFSQIGAALGIAESTARVHHRAGIAELRRRLWIPFCLAEIAWQWKKVRRRKSA